MMFVSQEWSSCAWAKKAEGKDVKKIVMNDNTLWPSVVYSIKTTKPLVHVLRIVDGEKTPAMGFIHGAMNEAKETIAKNCDGDLSIYKEIWDIIDEKWDNQLHRDLHAATYFLNPRYRWSPNVSEYAEIKTGLYKCMERLIKDQNIFMKVDEQLDSYKYKKELFGFKASMQSFMTRPPVIWWDNFGDEVPELKSFATKILGLTCSSSACERNWSTFNQVVSLEGHLEHLRKVFTRLREHKLYAKSSKYSFGQDMIEFLDHIIERGRIHMYPKKVQSIEDWKPSEDVYRVRSFLGLANYYKRFMKGYSEIACLLMDLMKKPKYGSELPKHKRPSRS
ncbi:hypothetical protein C2S53_008495 [Perilla frutescens var. hirtella]|uniref:HAT C-terminal dimerisation domain-containing protein n=1 Tax=Perilla frutescens var. hirtella TaxID=608512 RepID=A0AAD4PFY9_PERFH|nr:hypothetical protein C2S53_008495 [Perilla frutescens var. hirtella]